MFTDEELRIAKSADLCNIASRAGYTVVRVGNMHSLKEHDSVRIYNRNTWYRWSNKTGGTPIDFLISFCNMDFKEAVKVILDEQGYRNIQKGNESSVLSKNSSQIKQQIRKNEADRQKELVLPEKNSTFARVYAYLIKNRFISQDVINYFVKKGSIYEEKEHHNIVFVGKDKEGHPRHASKKGTLTVGQNYRGDAEGSDAHYGFSHIGKGDTLYVFEAAIDFLSFLTLYPKNWQEESYIVLNGVSEHAMLQTLKDYSHLQKVVLCLDHDKAGIEADFRLTDILEESGFPVSYLQSKNKDWNEDLKEKNGISPLPSQEHPKMEECKKWLLGIGEVSNFMIDEKMNVTELEIKYEKDMEEILENELSLDQINSLEIDLLYVTASLICQMKNYCEEFGKTISVEQIMKHIYKMYRPYKDKGNLKDQLKEIILCEKDRQKENKSGIQENRKKLGKLIELALSCIKIYLYIEIDLLQEKEKKSFTVESDSKKYGSKKQVLHR